jgi:hypothetical protein
MTPSFEETLIEVWRQTLVENAEVVVLGTERYPVRRTSKRGLRQVDFVFDGNEIRGLEQNPDTKSRWAQMARLSEQTAEAKLPPSSTSFLLPYICLYATICP